MSTIAEQVAAEHFFDGAECGHMACPEGAYAEWDEEYVRYATHLHHVAEVTEAATRAQIAADIEARRANAAATGKSYRDAGRQEDGWLAASRAIAYRDAVAIAEGVAS